MGKYTDITGQRFNRLLVIKRAEDRIKNDGRHEIRWMCKCDCGNVIYTNYHSLVSGNTKSCGCLRKEVMTEKNTKHSCASRDNKDRLYGVWLGMKARCYNPNNVHYNIYGGKGIVVCDEWRNDYIAFKNWAYSNGYDENADSYQCTIDRIDLSKGYYPDNCRWVNQKIQTNNMSINHIIEYKGEAHTLSQWADILNMSYKALEHRINRNWEIERAFTQPIRGWST